MLVPNLTIKTESKDKKNILWNTYSFPWQEGIKIHELGETSICVAIEQAGEGKLISVLPVYKTHTEQKKKAKTGKPVYIPPMTDPAWIRMLVSNGSEYSLLPAYPGLPVCIKLKEAFLLPAGAELEGWIFSRPEAQIWLANSLVASLPLRPPHKTLFGQPDTGIVCRYDEAEFLATGEPLFEAMIADPSLVSHPVRLKNSSQEGMLVEELCIYGEELSIFAQGDRMMSEKLSFVFSASGLKMSLIGQDPASSGWMLLTRPKISGEERFRVRSIELLRAITRLSL